MESSKTLAKFLRGVRANEINHGDILSVKVAEICWTLRLWMTCDRYEKATLLDKMLTLWYPHTHLVLFFGFLVYAMQHPQELPLPVIMQLVAYFLTSVTYYSGCLSFFFSRVQMTQLIRLVNEKNYAILNRPDASKFRSKSNQTYFGMVVMAFVFSLSGVMSALPVVIKLFTSGDVLFKTPWHNDFTPHGWQAITQNLLHTFSIAALAQFSALHWTIFIEVYVRVAWYFQILADDFRALRKDSTGEQRVVAEALEEMKLKNLLREYQDLRSIVGLANGIISVYLNAFVTLVYVTMGMVVALIASLDSTWAAAQFMFFPLYQYFLLATLCYLGQHVMDAGASCQQGIYDSGWTSAPMPFKKLMLLFLIQCTSPTMVDSKPFYELSFDLLGTITKTSFTLIAIIRKME